MGILCINQKKKLVFAFKDYIMLRIKSCGEREGGGGGEIDGAIAHSWVGNCQPGNLIYSVHALLTLSHKRQLYPSKVQGDNYKQVHPNTFQCLA